MKVLIDVNIFMDILQARAGVRGSLKLLMRLKKGEEYQGFISALTVPILYYLESRNYSDQEARANVRKLLEGFTIVDLTDGLIQMAFGEQAVPDFEDCIQYHSAKAAGCQVIITRNTKDFHKIELNVHTPEDYFAIINKSS